MPDSETAPAAEDTSAGPGIGDRLRAAREQRGLSVDQLAEHLHLDESVIVALEADDFEALGAPVFVRGHLKICARFLGLDADELLADYAAATPEPVVRPVSASGGSRPAMTINLLPWAAGALGLLLAGGLLVYLFQEDPEVVPAPVGGPPAVDERTPLTVARPDAAPPLTIGLAPAGDRAGSTPAPEAPPSVPIAAATRPPADMDGEAEIGPGPAPEPELESELEPELESEAETAPVAAQVAPATERRTLTLYFRGESWTEISDRNGRLLFGLQREGIRRELSGEAPFKLLLGNAPAVDLYLDNEPYDLPVGSTRGKVARFVIEPEPGQAFE